VKILIVGFIILLFLYFPLTAFAAINFTIANPTVSINDEIEVDASISGLITSSCSISGCYLQAGLRILDETKGFFGFTQNNSGEYVDYFSSPTSIEELKSKLFNIIPASGTWSGKLHLKNNQESINYVGPGQYALKFRRFSGNSTSATSGDSNVVTVALVLPQPTLTSTPTPTSASQNPTNTSTPTTSKNPTSAPTKIPASNVAIPTGKISGSISPSKITNQKNVLGESITSSVSAEPTKEIQKEVRVLSASKNRISQILIGIGFVFLITCGIVAGVQKVRKDKFFNE
jgi:hypothetical protein